MQKAFDSVHKYGVYDVFSNNCLDEGPMNILNILTRVGDKTGALGSVVSAMGCAMCFPAVSSIGAALGFGFLSQWESLFISTLLPIFAWLALLVNALGWFSHKQLLRSFLGMIGPTLLLLSISLLFQYDWSTYVTYIGLALMITISLWDMISPANKHCNDETCEV